MAVEPDTNWEESMSNNINKGMLRVGTVLHGTYCIEGYLSSGGFGNTYVATNVEFAEKYAIKEFFMKGVSQRDGNNTTVSVSNAENKSIFASQKEKFKKEARRLRKLHSEHIVRVYDLFEENGTAYYVMDYIDGMNLSKKLKQLGHPMPEKAVLKILNQVLDALATAHNYRDGDKHGILHLDLKPANLMLDKLGVVKLIDFGASKQQSASGGATISSAICYTNGYAPREQMEQSLGKFGPWTDFYALGATLYNLLTNKRPPLPTDIDDDDTPDKRSVLPIPPSVSDKTKKLVLWLMATDRKKRPQSVEDIYNYLAVPKVNDEDDTSDDDETLVVGDEETTIFLDEEVQEHISMIQVPPVNKGVPIFSHFFSYTGRIRRTEYWLSYLLPFLLMVSFFGIASFSDDPDAFGVASLAAMIVYLPWCIWIIFQNIKRCHDLNFSGWYQLIPLFVFVLFYEGGDGGWNKYGDNPRGKTTASTAFLDFIKTHTPLTIIFVILMVLGFFGFVRRTNYASTSESIVSNDYQASIEDIDSVAYDDEELVASPPTGSKKRKLKNNAN